MRNRSRFSTSRMLLAAASLACAGGLLAHRAYADPPQITAQRNAQTTAPQQDELAVPVRIQPPALTPPTLAIEKYTLENGLEVILHEDHRSPTVSVNIWYHVGSKDEPMGRNGFAHLFEHLMFQGSKHVAEDTYFLNLERIGASGINGTTGDDRTNYFETVPAGRLNLALWLESDRMGYLLDHVNQETLDSQRQVVLNEYRQSYENSPVGMIWKYLHEALYPVGHPYHRLAIGTKEDLNAANLQDVQRFFRTWYVPNNATLSIAGDFKPDEAKALVQQYFGSVPRGRDVPRAANPAPVTLTEEKRLIVEARVELPRVFVAWHSPAFFQPGDATLDLVANVLSHGRNSRLYRRLVHELQLASEVSAFQDSGQLASSFYVVATANKGHTAEELLEAIDKELADASAQLVDDAELFRARTEIETQTIFSLESVSGRADRFNLYNQHVGSPDYLRQDIQRYQSLTAQDLQNAMREYLAPNKRVVALVHPKSDAPIAGALVSGGAQ